MTATRSCPTEQAPAPGPRASVTRERILAAARRRFSQHSYENVGTRDVAADAGVDAALVNRYFGGKERLFAEVVAGGFHASAHIGTDLGHLGTRLAAQVLEDAPGPTPGLRAFDALRVLLRAAGNPAVAAVVSRYFHAEFVQPLARLLPGRDRDARAALIASYVIGLATMRHGLCSPVLEGPALHKAGALAAAAIQACVDGPAVA